MDPATMATTGMIGVSFLPPREFKIEIFDTTATSKSTCCSFSSTTSGYRPNPASISTHTPVSHARPNIIDLVSTLPRRTHARPNPSPVRNSTRRRSRSKSPLLEGRSFYTDEPLNEALLNILARNLDQSLNATLDQFITSMGMHIASPIGAGLDTARIVIPLPLRTYLLRHCTNSDQSQPPCFHYI